MSIFQSDRVSMIQVAKEANVSIQTVSRVINNQPGVSVKTRLRVQKIIEDLGYYPSRAARAMRGSSKTLGIVGFGLQYYGPSRTLVGAQLEASRHGYGVVLQLVQDPQNIDVRGIFEMMLSSHVDGIVWCIPHIGANVDSVVAQLEKLPIPLIFTDTSSISHNLVIHCDNYFGGKLASDHLISAGHEVIGIITGPSSYFSGRERLRGWRDALQMEGLSPNDDLIVEGNWEAQSGAQALKTLLKRHPEITAIFACNDQMALGVLHAAVEMGLRVPHDLAVIGYDDIPEAAFFSPSLSSVRQDVVDLGGQAVSQVIHAIETIAIRGEYSPHSLVIQPELVIRASSLREA
jgi:LacI family transcriptional regulator